MPTMMTCLSSEAPFFLGRYTMWLTMDVCIPNFWAGSPKCYLDTLDKLQKRICRTVCPTFSLSIMESNSFSVGITLVDFHLN